MFEDESEGFFIDVTDEMIEEALPAIMSSNPFGACLFHGDLRLFNFGSIIDEMDSNIDFTPHLESSSCLYTYEPLPSLAGSAMPTSLVSPSKLELKPLPDSLKYVFLGPKETLSIIISSLLSYDQEKELIHVLSNHKSASGWSIVDLKKISLIIYMHRIYLEDNAELVKQMKRRLKPFRKKLFRNR